MTIKAHLWPALTLGGLCIIYLFSRTTFILFLFLFFQIGNRYALLSGQNAEHVIVRYFGIFFLLFQSSSVWGNIISSTGKHFQLEHDILVLSNTNAHKHTHTHTHTHTITHANITTNIDTKRLFNQKNIFELIELADIEHIVLEKKSYVTRYLSKF